MNRFALAIIAALALGLAGCTGAARAPEISGLPAPSASSAQAASAPAASVTPRHQPLTGPYRVGTYQLYIREADTLVGFRISVNRLAVAYPLVPDAPTAPTAVIGTSRYADLVADVTAYGTFDAAGKSTAETVTGLPSADGTQVPLQDLLVPDNYRVAAIGYSDIVYHLAIVIHDPSNPDELVITVSGNRGSAQSLARAILMTVVRG